MQMKKIAADMSIMKKDLAKLANMGVRISNIELQLKESKQNSENF